MNGFVIIDKEQGMTSFKASAALRKIYGEKKTGHTGTLDPMATGVLPVALGRATRFIDFLPETDKSYTARFKLGIETDTLDITGNILSEKEVSVPIEALLAVLDGFKGDIMQLPPMFSARSVNGVRLYKLARRGIEVERESRPVSIKELELKSCEDTGEYEISVRCSKGTYIRSLIADIGSCLGTSAVMTALRRTSSNGFCLAQARRLSQLEPAAEAQSAVIPVDRAFDAFPAVYVSFQQAKRFSNGGELALDRLNGVFAPALYRVYSSEKLFLGLGEVSSEKPNALAVKRVI